MARFTYSNGGCVCSRDECSDDCVTYRLHKPKKSTNSDRIRAFTDEELARFIVRESPCPDGYTSVFGPHCVEDNGCERCWLEWLGQEDGKQ